MSIMFHKMYCIRCKKKHKLVEMEYKKTDYMNNKEMYKCPACGWTNYITDLEAITDKMHLKSTKSYLNI